MKHHLRHEIRATLAQLKAHPNNTIALSDDILPPNTKTLFIYLPQGNEIDCTPIISLALNRNIVVAAPCVRGTTMEFRTITSATGPFCTGKWGIREPQAGAPFLWPQGNTRTAANLLPLVILIPGLAFTLKGARLGQGKGYYDRFLSSLLSEYSEHRKEITLIGTCHHWQIIKSLPTDPHDISVDCLLSEQSCILCSEN